MAGKTGTICLKAKFRHSPREFVLCLQEKPKTMTSTVSSAPWGGELQINLLSILRGRLLHLMLSPASLRLPLHAPSALCWTRWMESKNRLLLSIPRRKAQEGGWEAREEGDPGKTTPECERSQESYDAVLHMEKVRPREDSESITQQHTANVVKTLVFKLRSRLSPLYKFAVLPLQCLFTPPSILDLNCCLACLNWWASPQTEPVYPLRA